MRLGLGLSIPMLQGRDAVFSPASLFAGGVQGFVMEPNASNCFTDAARTTPAGDGDPVGGMLDTSGNGNHFSQSTSASRPTLVQSGAVWHLDFDGIDDLLSTASITPGADTVQVCATVTALDNTVAGYIVESSANAASNNGAFLLRAPPGAGLSTADFVARGTASQIATLTGVTYPLSTVFFAEADISDPYVRVGTTEIADVTNTGSLGTGNFLANAIHVGDRVTGSRPLNGNLYFLMVRFGPALSAEQKSALLAYAAERAGL